MIKIFLTGKYEGFVYDFSNDEYIVDSEQKEYVSIYHKTIASPYMVLPRSLVSHIKEY